MLILICSKYYVLETRNVGDMTKFSELPEQPSYVGDTFDKNVNNIVHKFTCVLYIKV